MTRVLSLTYRMAQGYGVDVVVGALSRKLVARGVDCHIGCIDADSTYSDLNVHTLAGELESVKLLCQALKPDLIVAHTSPFFEMLPELKRFAPCWAYEYGDPTPELFGKDAPARQAIKDFKSKHVYPVVDGVIAISDFIRRDISFPKAHVIYIDFDHVPLQAPKTSADMPGSKRKLRVGTLMRLGKGEAHYKGSGLFLELVETLQKRGLDFTPCYLGRGEESDVAHLRAGGCDVWLNATEDRKWDYLRSLDVFVTCSQWEGCNLPLLEAQALGTAALAFEAGAHPEICPLIFSDISEAAEMIDAFSKNDELLLRHSQVAHVFVHERFAPKPNEIPFAELVGLKSLVGKPQRSLSWAVRANLFYRRVTALVKTYGLRILILKVLRRMYRQTSTRLFRR